MPSHHSGSSHSSHSSHSSSRSSFSGSSSRSSLSRSSSSGTRSSYTPSFKSGSSHSSLSSASGRSIFSGYSSRPSRKSMDSRSSDPGSGTYSPKPGYRPRINQPLSPSMSQNIIHCVNHDYVYYPSVQILGGTRYEPGYYDESGNRYDSIAFSEQSGDPVAELTCEYCGSVARYKWTEGTIPNCGNCGAPMTVKNIVSDTVISSDSTGLGSAKFKKKRKFWLILIILIIIAEIGIANISNKNQPQYLTQDPYAYSNTQSSADPVSDRLYLKNTGNNIYELADEPSASKVLEWSSADEAYYDEDTGAWLWLNTEVSPSVWQYWYEGISPDYGDFGWMECEGSKWYIEVSEGNWQEYKGDTSGLWHIRNSFDS